MVDLTCEERPSDSPLVEMIWRSHSGYGGSFHSMAEIHCGIVVTKFQGKITLTVRGPEIRATPADAPEDAAFVGIVFKVGSYMPNLPASVVKDRQDVNLPEAGSDSFWLNGSAWQFPDFENADTFVNRLVRDGLLVHDSLVDTVLQGEARDISRRTVQRRFSRATGLTQGELVQIERARYATRLLKQGVSILDTVYAAGYFDQPHLTRSLKYFVGLTPAQILDQSRTQKLSFLYKAAPLLLSDEAAVHVTTKRDPTFLAHRPAESRYALQP